MVSEDSLDKKKQYNQQKLELHEKENLYNKLKDTFNSDKERKQKRNWWFRLSFIVLSIVGLGLTLFSFVTQNLIFGVIFAILTVIFIVGTFLLRQKKLITVNQLVKRLMIWNNKLMIWNLITI